MKGTKADLKHIGLAKLVFTLRQDIDLYRVIGLNVEVLRERGGSQRFWAHIQRLAHESIALSICKIYESEKRHNLNSIPGVIRAVTPVSCDAAQQALIRKFAAAHGCVEPWTTAEAVLYATLGVFTDRHADSLRRLKEFRDKFSAHSEHDATLTSLPSIDDFEQCYAFANAFYRLVAEVFIGVVPSLIHSHAGTGAIRVMQALGIEAPAFDFPKDVSGRTAAHN